MRKITAAAFAIILIACCAGCGTGPPAQPTATISSPAPPAATPTAAPPPTATQAPPPTETPQALPLPAAVGDLAVNDLKYGSMESEVKAALGAPDNTERYVQQADGSNRADYHYGKNTYGFAEDEKGGYYLVSTDIVEGDFKLSRGIVSGMSKDAVIAKFPSGYDGRYPIETESVILYTAGVETSGNGYDVIMPPRGLIYGEGQNALEYMFPTEDYPSGMDPMDFVYHPHGTMIFTFDENNALSAVSWRVGALAE